VRRANLFFYLKCLNTGKINAKKYRQFSRVGVAAAVFCPSGVLLSAIRCFSSLAAAHVSGLE
jgi:hypothetical protein